MTHPTPGRLAAETRRLGQMLLVALVASWPPLIAGRIVLGSPAMTILLYASIIGFLNTVAGGRRVGAAASVVFLLVAPVALVVGVNPFAGACLMALACLFVGTSAYWQRFGGFGTILVGMAFIMASPASVVNRLDGGPSQTWYLVAVLIGAACCAFWPVVVAPWMHAVQAIPLDQRYSKPDTIRYVAAITVLVSSSMFYALAFARDTNGVWLPLTLIMVLRVGADATRHRAFQRLWGTIAGAAFAAVAASLVHPQWAIAALIVIALLGMFATMGREPYGLFAFFLTTLVLLATSAGEPVLEASYQRVLYTAIGAALALAAYGAKIGIADLVQHRRHTA